MTILAYALITLCLAAWLWTEHLERRDEQKSLWPTQRRAWRVVNDAQQDPVVFDFVNRRVTPGPIHLVPAPLVPFDWSEEPDL